MPKVPPISPHPEKYEGMRFLTYEQTTDYLGIKMAALYKKMKLYKIPSHKFEGDRRHYIGIGDVKRMALYIKEPWRAESKEKGE